MAKVMKVDTSKIVGTVLPDGPYRGQTLGQIMRNNAGVSYLMNLGVKRPAWLTAATSDAVRRFLKLPELQRLVNLIETREIHEDENGRPRSTKKKGADEHE